MFNLTAEDMLRLREGLERDKAMGIKAEEKQMYKDNTDSSEIYDAEYPHKDS